MQRMGDAGVCVSRSSAGALRRRRRARVLGAERAVKGVRMKVHKGGSLVKAKRLVEE